MQICSIGTVSRVVLSHDKPYYFTESKIQDVSKHAKYNNYYVHLLIVFILQPDLLFLTTIKQK